MTKVTQCRCYNCRNKVGRCMNLKIKEILNLNTTLESRDKLQESNK